MTTTSARRPTRRAALVLVALGMALAFLAAPALLPASAPVPSFLKAAPAVAATGDCSWPRCTLLLNREETQKAGEGITPPPPVPGFGQILWAAVQVHKLLIRAYYDQGKCVGFNLSAVPWETQGLFGYDC